MNTTPQYLTTAEAADMLNIPHLAFLDVLDEGKIPAEIHDGHWRILLRDVLNTPVTSAPTRQERRRIAFQQKQEMVDRVGQLTELPEGLGSPEITPRQSPWLTGPDLRHPLLLRDETVDIEGCRFPAHLPGDKLAPEAIQRQVGGAVHTATLPHP